MYSPKTLYALAKKTVRNVYKNHWNETKVLPKSIQRELLKDWLRCDETLPESGDELDKIVERMEDGWESLLPMCPAIFIHLMRLPNEVPPFAYERNHIIWNYYKWTDDGIEKKICANCFVNIGQRYKPFSANLWFDKNWSFERIEDHTMLSGDELLEDLIWLAENWCVNCIYEPLWEHIFDDADCLAEYDYHFKRRRRWSSSSEDSDIDFCKTTAVKGNRIDPNMYNIYKSNKWL